jgi:hypothetical protein
VSTPSGGWFGSNYKNFSSCPHCAAKGDSGMIVRMTESSPLISRSDGSTYHLFLQDGPNRRYRSSGELIAGELIATFRYAHDKFSLRSEQLRIFIKNPGQSNDEITKQLEDVADRLAVALQGGSKLARLYTFENGTLSQVHEP